MTGDHSKKDKKKLSWNISDRDTKKSGLKRQSRISWKDIKYYKCYISVFLLSLIQEHLFIFISLMTVM